MKTEKWITNLVVDTDQLKTNLECRFKDKNTPITIMVKYAADGARDSNWIYGKIPIKHTNKIFKFGIYLLTGKAVVLLIQDSSDWITGDYEDKLKKACYEMVKCRAKKFYINYNWSRQIDEFCGTQLTCYTWVDESQLQSSEKSFVNGLILEYQNLWIKKKGQVENMKIEDKVVEERVGRALYKDIWELFVHLDEAMNVNGLPLEKKLTILDEASKNVMKTIRELTEKGYAPFKDYLNILEKHI